MRPRTPHGSRSHGPRSAALAASTFVELVVTIFLLTVFAALIFPVFWSTSRATTAHAMFNAVQRSKLSLATVLPRLTDEVRPPYWVSQEKVFLKAGTEWRALYRNGRADDFLVLRKEGDSRLSLVTSEGTLSIDNLPGLSIDWWEKNKRIIGVTVQWRQGTETMEFHASWGSFIL
jgi:hypothetical protein